MIASLSSVIKKLLVLFLIFAGLYFAKEILMPLCIGGILATLFLPLCNSLEKKKIPKTVAALICLVVFLIIIVILISLLGFKITELLSDLASIKHKSLETANSVQEYIFNHLNISKDAQFQILIKEQPSYSNIMQLVLRSVMSFLTNFVLVLAYFVFLLLSRNHIKIFLLRITKTTQHPEMEKVLFSITRISQQYLLGLSKMIVLLWVMYGIGFTIIGVENAVFFAVLCGFLEIVPYLGNIVGIAITVVIAAVNGGNPELLVGIVITYGIIQLIQTSFFEPLILGPQVKINPLFTIIILVIGELLWGIPGLILAIPLMGMFKIVCDHIEALKPYGFLIGEIDKSKVGVVERIKTKLQHLNKK
ncbi:MAG: AI-2E family transporter [Flavobacterium sp.]